MKVNETITLQAIAGQDTAVAAINATSTCLRQTTPSPRPKKLKGVWQAVTWRIYVSHAISVSKVTCHGLQW